MVPGVSDSSHRPPASLVNAVAIIISAVIIIIIIIIIVVIFVIVRRSCWHSFEGGENQDFVEATPEEINDAASKVQALQPWKQARAEVEKKKMTAAASWSPGP